MAQADDTERLGPLRPYFIATWPEAKLDITIGMKNGVILVNASRGGVIEENDLLEALNSGKVAGAGLDVFEGEPKPKHELMNHPKISVTPHIGAATKEAQERIGIELAEKIIESLK